MSDQVPIIKIKADTAKGFRIINASAFDATKHERHIDAPPAFVPPAPLAPPPGPIDPLASLPADWRDSVGNTELRNIAAALGDGRAVDNRDQAIAVIDAALLAKASQ